MQAALEAEGQEALSGPGTGSAQSPVASPSGESPSKSVSETVSAGGQAKREHWTGDKKGSAGSEGSEVVRKDHLEAIRDDSEESDSEFFDCAESVDGVGSAREFMAHRPNVVRWSSVEMLAIEEEGSAESPPITPNLSGSEDQIGSPRGAAASSNCPVTLLILVFHGGSVLDCQGTGLGVLEETLSGLPPSTPNAAAKQSDLQTLSGTLDLVIRTHYPQLWGRVALRLVSCPCIGAEAINLLVSLSPYGSDQFTSEYSGASASLDGCCHPALIPLLAVDSHSYDDHVLLAIHKANQVVNDFLGCEEGHGFSGEVCIIGDSLGGLLAYDILVKQRVTSLSRNPSQMSARSDVTDVSMPIPEDEQLEQQPLPFRFEPDEGDAAHTPMANGHTAQSHRNHRPPPLEHLASDQGTGSHILNGPCPQYLSALGGHAANIPRQMAHRHLSAPESSAGSSPPRGRSLSSEVEAGGVASTSYHRYRKAKLDFRVSSLFLVGTPLGMVLAHRKVARGAIGPDATELMTPAPACNQVCNLYYAIDPCCARIEPLLCQGFSRLPPVNVPRYSRFPLGDGQSLHLVDCIQRHQENLLAAMKLDAQPERSRKHSSVSSASEVEGSVGASLSCFQNITGKWWGSRRVDFALYCPEGLATLPKVALPNLLHSSFWENTDVAAFIMRQFVTGDDFTSGQEPGGRFGASLSLNAPLFAPSGPTEKWTRKRTAFKIKNAAANHRANDIIVAEFQPQVLHARFMYGPLDVVALGGERVDVYIKTETEASGKLGDWVKFGTESTDNHGRLTFNMPEEKRLPLGLYPVKMVVRGDHTYLDMFLAVVPPQTECVVFSIDGSFTASVSVTGKDPKVRPGAVDVVRHWQDLGYLILYITARPDMQQKQVISWLAQHNFPHGLLFFTDGISTDPLKQKTQYLKQLVDQRQLKLQAGYGSGKDIHVYSAAGIPCENTFVIGKVSKKLQAQSQVLCDGYSIHLSQLTSGSLQSVGRPAQGNGRLLIRKGCFSLPGQYRSVTVQRSQSFTPRTGKYYDSQSSVQSEVFRGVSNAGGSAKRRGMSPFRMISRSSVKNKEKQAESS